MQIKPEVLKGWGPGGWIYFQPETNWWAPFPMSNTFDQQCDNIITMRKQNPRFNLPIDKPTVAAELESFTIARWSKKWSKNGMQRFLAGGEEDKKKESNFTQPALRALNAVAGLAGIDPSSLEEWLGSGGRPVHKSLAEQRAAICAKCETANQKTGWRRLLTVPAAMSILKFLEYKNLTKLSTSLDSELGSCTICNCVLELKIWQPIGFVRETSDAELVEKHRSANPNCWVAKELKAE